MLKIQINSSGKNQHDQIIIEESKGATDDEGN